jgi:signal transduction histidine kinase
MLRNIDEYRIFVVKDNPSDFRLFEDFKLEQFSAPLIMHAGTFLEAKQILGKAGHMYTAVLLDIAFPDHKGELLIRKTLKLCEEMPVIVLTGNMDFAFGVKSLSLGISDYLIKNELNSMSLYKSVVYCIEHKKNISALETSEKRVRNFANQLNNALEEDRARIAREIHDEFGQQLSGLKMSLVALKKSGMKGIDQETFINALIADVNISISSVRQIANELRPILIDRLGLYAAIEWLFDEFEKKTTIKCQIYGETVLPAFTKEVEINVFRICQETLTNIAKHGKATIVKIQIESLTNELIIRIIDNGDGINWDKIHNSMSMGILNMKERAKLIGAELNILSSLSKGTIIELNVAINGKENTNSGRPFGN